MHDAHPPNSTSWDSEHNDLAAGLQSGAWGSSCTPEDVAEELEVFAISKLSAEAQTAIFVEIIEDLDWLIETAQSLPQPELMPGVIKFFRQLQIALDRMLENAWLFAEGQLHELNHDAAFTPHNPYIEDEQRNAERTVTEAFAVFLNKLWEYRPNAPKWFEKAADRALDEILERLRREYWKRRREFRIKAEELQLAGRASQAAVSAPSDGKPSRTGQCERRSDEQPATPKTKGMRCKDANKEAIRVLGDHNRSSADIKMTLKNLADIVGCSQGLIAKTAAWKVYQQEWKKLHPPRPKAVHFTKSIASVHGQDDEELERLKAEHAADFEESPLVPGGRRHIRRAKV